MDHIYRFIGRRKGYRPNRIRMEENIDQQEATDLTSKPRDSIHVLDDMTPESHNLSKAPRMERLSTIEHRSSKNSHRHDQSKTPTLNIRSDLRKQSSTLDSTNLMSSLNKGLESFGGENNHRVRKE